MYAMMVPSGNDAAEALAIIFGGYLTNSRDSDKMK